MVPELRELPCVPAVSDYQSNNLEVRVCAQEIPNEHTHRAGPWFSTPVYVMYCTVLYYAPATVYGCMPSCTKFSLFVVFHLLAFVGNKQTNKVDWSKRGIRDCHQIMEAGLVPWVKSTPPPPPKGTPATFVVIYQRTRTKLQHRQTFWEAYEHFKGVAKIW